MAFNQKQSASFRSSIVRELDDDDDDDDNSTGQFQSLLFASCRQTWRMRDIKIYFK
jgi:hypothetical protein